MLQDNATLKVLKSYSKNRLKQPHQTQSYSEINITEPTTHSLGMGSELGREEKKNQEHLYSTQFTILTYIYTNIYNNKNAYILPGTSGKNKIKNRKKYKT